MMRTKVRVGAAAAMLLALVSIAAGCGGDDGGGGSGTIALLLPENHTPRYEASDRPKFEKKVKELCSDCKLLYSNATQDAAKQQNQADAALTQGADVLVVDAVDAGSAASIVKKAKAQDVPVVSYDRLITDSDVDYYISYDNERGRQAAGRHADQGTEGAEQAHRPGRDAGRRPGGQQRQAVQEGRERRPEGGWREDRQVVRHPGWSADKAQNEMQQSITSLGNGGFAGVLGGQRRPRRRRDRGDEVSRDQALRPPDHRPGRDAGRTAADSHRRAVHDRLEGEQAGGRRGGTDRSGVGKGRRCQGWDLINQQVDNGQKKVPSVILRRSPSSRPDVKKVVDGGDVKAADLCKGKFEERMHGRRESSN